MEIWIIIALMWFALLFGGGLEVGYGKKNKEDDKEDGEI